MKPDITSTAPIKQPNQYKN